MDSGVLGGLPPLHIQTGMREVDMSQREFIVASTQPRSLLSPPGRGLSLIPQKTGKRAFPMPAELQKWKPSFKKVTSSQVTNSPGPHPRVPWVSCVETGWGSSRAAGPGQGSIKDEGQEGKDNSTPREAAPEKLPHRP